MDEIKKVLVPIDFSENAPRILKAAKMVAEKFGAKLNILYVVQQFDDYSGFFVPHVPFAQFEEELLQGAEKRMTEFVHEHLGEGAPHEHKVLVGDVAEEIVEYAENEQSDLIVMGTHGYKGIERVLFGSVAEKIVKSAPCPVLTVNPYK